jgi:hypothetical protein
MKRIPGTIERAFELARNSPILTVEKIRRQLKAEGYIDWEFQLSGREIRRQLQALVVAKRKRLAHRANVSANHSGSAP